MKHKMISDIAMKLELQNLEKRRTWRQMKIWAENKIMYAIRITFEFMFQFCPIKF